MKGWLFLVTMVTEHTGEATEQPRYRIAASQKDKRDAEWRSDGHEAPTRSVRRFTESCLSPKLAPGTVLAFNRFQSASSRVAAACVQPDDRKHRVSPTKMTSVTPGFGSELFISREA
jgi:hypothetical protein